MEHPLTPAQLGAQLGVSARTMNRWCRDGRIATIGKISGRTGAWLIGTEGVAQAIALTSQPEQVAS